MDVLFWGATGQAKVLKEALDGSNYRLVALIDNRSLVSPWPDVPLLPGAHGLEQWLACRERRSRPLRAAVAIGGGNGGERVDLMDWLISKGIQPLTVVHRRAFVAEDSSLGEGCQILAQSAVCSHARLGRGVIVNTSASVDHDCQLGDGVHIGPGAHLAGEVEVGSRSFVGTGATVLPRIKIGCDAIVGAGAVVTRDVPAGATVIGIPARPVG